MRPGLGWLLPLLCAGCVTGEWRQDSRDEPFPALRVEALRPGTDTLRECLASLGAPHHVFEYAVAGDGASGMALVWISRDASGFGIDVSSGTDEVPGSFQFDSDDVELPACVLWFDRELLLERWRIGTVGELLRSRVRPAPVDLEP